MISCPNSKQLVATEALNKCYHDSSAFICSTHVLTVATNISWLGFPFNPDSKLTFPQHHVTAKDCSNLHPVVHLGGRMFLATSVTSLPLSSGPLTTRPLSVYTIPCNISFFGKNTGLGCCTDHLSVSVPLSSASTMQFTPWEAVVTSTNHTVFDHPTLDIPAPSFLNKTVLAELDSTFQTLDGDLSATTSAAENEINDITETSTISTTCYMACFALGLSMLSCLSWFIVCYFFFSRHAKNPNTLQAKVCRCGRQQAPAGTSMSLRQHAGKHILAETSTVSGKDLWICGGTTTLQTFVPPL